MCTLSWWRRDGALSLRFNRDEQRQRMAAEAPALREGLIWPRDPQGGGTWICVDAAGTVHCLLNDYMSEPPAGVPLRSRGELPLRAAGNSDTITEWLCPEVYAPFHLFRIPRVGEIRHVHWDGRRLTEGPAHPEMTLWSSSGWHPRPVVKSREDLFVRLRAERGISEDMLHAFHCFKDPERPAYGPWMTRADAKTVSISEIKVDDQGILFSYVELSDDRMLPPYEIFQPIREA